MMVAGRVNGYVSKVIITPYNIELGLSKKERSKSLSTFVLAY